MDTPREILLRFHSFNNEVLRGVWSVAYDIHTLHPVKSLSLEMMRAWLARNGYSWRFGSNGVWEK